MTRWSPLIAGAVASLALACTPPPRPEALKTFETLRIGEHADRVETRQPELFAEAQAHYRAALVAYENDEDVASSRHYAQLATLTWEAAVARSQQQDHQDALTAARSRGGLAQSQIGAHLRRITVAKDALGRQARLVEMQARMAEMERKARTQRTASKAKTQIDAAALEIKAAEGVDAARHAAAPFEAARGHMTAALDAFDGGNYPEAHAAAQEAWRAARTAIGVSQPLHDAEVAAQALAARLGQLVEAGAALPGAEAHLEPRGVVVRLRDLFKTGASTLADEAASTVDGVAALGAKHPDLKLVIEGHTDNRGRAKANLTLSEARAQAVAARLTAGGVDAQRINAVGRGDEAPIADNSTKAGRAQNRRVEVVFVRPQ